MSAEDPAAPPRRPMPVPPVLEDMAGWTWRLLLLALAGYLFVRLLDTISFVVLPFIGAMFLTTLAYPLVRLLRRWGLRSGAATGITAVLAAVVFGGVAVFVVDRAVAQYPQLVNQVSDTVTHFRNFLTRDLHIRSSSTASISTTITAYLKQHSNSVASGAVSGIATVGEGAAAFVLFLFMTFFLLYDGENIWAWVVRMFPSTARDRVRGAGAQAWARLAGFVRGTFIIALIHAVVAAVSLSIMRVPLVAPIAVLVFFGSFLPIVGSIIFGALAVAITIVTRGLGLGIVLAGILIIDNQVEAHLLQPLLVGRYVRLHPLAVAVSIAGGGVLEGIYGAILAVPFVAVVYAVARYLVLGDDDDTGGSQPGGAKDPPGKDGTRVPFEDDDAPDAEDKLVPETS